MNSFGKLFQVQIFGESHGEGVGILIDGCPPGISLKVEDFKGDLDRRRGGAKGTTPRAEADIPKFLSGVFNDHTTGAPIAIWFANENIRSADYEKIREFPRPGHADFVASQKFGGFEDYRGGGHFSGRLTLPLVAAGVVAKKILSSLTITATILEIGGETDLEKGLQKGIDAKDSVGGLIECTVNGLPVGWGEPFFDSVESKISALVFSIPAIRGIEFGTGFKAAAMFGSKHNDAIIDGSGKTATNHAGGVVGGITNGNPFVFRVAVKPTSSTPQNQQTLNINSGEVESFAVRGRHDLCIALRVPPVLEGVTAIALADLFLQRGSGAPALHF